MQNSEGSEATAPRPPGPSAPAWPAAAHLCLTTRAPAQGAHRLLPPRLSRRREIRGLFALKIHPCGTRASIARGSRASDLPTSPCPVLTPTFQDPSLGADPHMIPTCPGSRHLCAWQLQPRFRRTVRVTSARGVRSGPRPFLGVSKSRRGTDHLPAPPGFALRKRNLEIFVCGDLKSNLTVLLLE